MQDTIATNCPTCRNPLLISAQMANAAIRCKGCGHAFHVRPRSEKAARHSTVLVARPADPSRLAALRGIAVPQNAPPPGVEVITYDESQVEANGALSEIDIGRSRRGHYRGPNKASPLFVLIPLGLFIIAALGGGLWLIIKNQGAEQPSADGSSPREVASSTPDKPVIGGLSADPKKVKPPVPAAITKEAWPRRLLMISVNDYFYTNPLLAGANNAAEKEGERRDVYGIASRMQNRWMIPKDQTYILSDGPTMDKMANVRSRLPMKQVVEQTIERFLAAAGEYDRNIILFSGHAIEKDGKAYLVPIDAELDQVDGMIPLEWFYDKLDKCKSKDNLVIFDVCRYDLSRGFERPAFGVMTDKLEEALHHPPAGVGVWTSCSKEEYSFEFNYAKPPTPELQRYVIKGSLFLSLMSIADQAGKMGKNALSDKPVVPSDPIQMEAFQKYLADNTPLAAKSLVARDNDLKVKTQTPKFTANPKAASIPYDPKMTLAADFKLPESPAVVDRQEVSAILHEIEIPPLKGAAEQANNVKRLVESLPFSADALKDYLPDVSVEEIRKQKDKYAFRYAILDAIERLREIEHKGSGKLRDVIENDINDKFKAQIRNNEQRTISERQLYASEVRGDLERLGKMKEKEPSKRWRANYDYVLAQAKFFEAYYNEYNLTLGKIVKDELPPLDKELNQKTYKLALVEKMASAKEIRDMVEDAKKTLTQMTEDYKGTPYAMLGKMGRGGHYGMRWQPAN